MQRHYPLNPNTGLEDASLLPWTNGNPSTGTDGSYPPFGLFTSPQEEILNAIAAAGLTATDADLTQLSKAINARAKAAVGRGVTVVLNAVQAIPDTTETAIIWPTPLVDTDQVWNGGQPSRLYFPPGTKRIRVSYEVCFEAWATGSRKARALANGGTEGFGLPAARQGSADASDVSILQGTGGIFDLTSVPSPLPTDGTSYLQLRIVQNGGGSLNLRAFNTWMTVEWLG